MLGRVSRTADNLGQTFQHMRRSQEAVTTHQEAVAIYRETGNRFGEVQG